MAESESKVARLRCDDPIYCDTRTRPMRVLVLGLPRTGTYSVFLACRTLGLQPYHFATVWEKRHMRPWIDALKAKYQGRGKPWGRPEFDRLLGDSDCTMDVPTTVFVDELVAAYPEAKVILTNRDLDKWYASMTNTLFKVFQWPSWRVLQYLDPDFAGVYYSHVRVTWAGFCGWDFGPSVKDKYQEHYEHVRAIVPKERLLEYQVSDGWEPLCKFLEVDVPDGKFPKANDVEQFDAHHILLWQKSVQRSVSSVTRYGVLATLSLAGMAYWRKTRPV